MATMIQFQSGEDELGQRLPTFYIQDAPPLDPEHPEKGATIQIRVVNNSAAAEQAAEFWSRPINDLTAEFKQDGPTFFQGTTALVKLYGDKLYWLRGIARWKTEWRDSYPQKSNLESNYSKMTSYYCDAFSGGGGSGKLDMYTELVLLRDRDGEIPPPSARPDA